MRQPLLPLLHSVCRDGELPWHFLHGQKERPFGTPLPRSVEMFRPRAQHSSGRWDTRGGVGGGAGVTAGRAGRNKIALSFPALQEAVSFSVRDLGTS